MSSSAYSNCGLQNSASNGQTSMQMPQYMQSRSRWRSGRGRCAGARARPGWSPGSSPCGSRCRCTSRGTRARRACTTCSSPRAGAMTPRLRGRQVGGDVGVLGRVRGPRRGARRRGQPLEDAGQPPGAGAHHPSTTPAPVSSSWSERERDEPEPGQPLQLVLAQAGPRDAHPDDDDGDDEALEQGPQPAQGVLERAVPAAEPERGEEQRHDDDAGVLGEQEEGEAQPGVLGPGAHDELGVGHGHVEGRPLQLGARRRRGRRARPAAATASTTATSGR